MSENRSGLRTLVDILERSRVMHAQRPALALRGRGGRVGWTYAELGRRADRFADLLAERGVGRGERVLIWAPNQPWWAAVFFGCLKLGAVAVPLDARGNAEFTRRVAELTRARLLVLGADQAGLLGESSAPSVRIESLESLIGDPRAENTPFVEPSPEDLAEIVFTSGTTGDPKGVMITHANLLSDVLSFDEHVMAVPSYRLLSVLPLSHLFEQSVGLCDALMAGASVTYVQTLQPSSIFEALVEEQITAMLAVPQVLSLFYAGIEREVRKQGKEGAWRIMHQVAPRLPFALRRHLFRTVHRRLGGKFEFFVVGGAFLDPALAAKWENMGVKVVQGYGTTECSPGVTATSLDRRRLDSVGRPLSCCEVRVADDGEVLVRGPNVTAGYWENPRATAESFEDGWYKTGDLGFFDDQGYLHLKGRKKNLIVLGNGMNVYPEDVENVLVKIDGVRDAVVVGLDRAEAEVDVHAVLLLEDASRAADVVKEANHLLASHQRIHSHTVWPEPDFPRTPTLKAKRGPIFEHVKGRYAGPTRAR
jgi:long-chain acyl-CoA synthetase